MDQIIYQTFGNPSMQASQTLATQAGSNAPYGQSFGVNHVHTGGPQEHQHSQDGNPGHVENQQWIFQDEHITSGVQRYIDFSKPSSTHNGGIKFEIIYPNKKYF